MVKTLSTSLQSLRALLARADAVLEHRHQDHAPVESSDAPGPAPEQDGWDDTLALVIAAREQIEHGEERIVALQAQGRELEGRLAEEVASMTARLGDMDARYGAIDAARSAAEERESRARERLATAMQFYGHMNHTLRTALRRSRLVALRDEPDDSGDADPERSGERAEASAAPETAVEVLGRDGNHADAAKRPGPGDRPTGDERSDSSAAR
jgi:hypothetical protein